MLNNRDQILPDFLCIGVERSGTTWLYEILKNHPEVYLYPYIKEINFFSVNYQNGLRWYEKFFRSSKKSPQFKILGDISPTYFHYKEVPARVARDIPNSKFILLLRNPIDRAFSEYRYNRLILNNKESFKEFLDKRPHSFKLGLYSRHLKNWLKFFPQERFLILLFEEMMNNKYKTLKNISRFLGINYDAFDNLNVTKKIHSSDIPKFHLLYTFGYKFSEYINNFLMSYDLYSLSSKLKIFKKIFYLSEKKKDQDKLNLRLKNKLYAQYSTDIKELENLLNIDLSIWLNSQIV
ncbi:MAG: sulfotransferase [Candidatus Thorarchaeota archaeon]